MSPQITSSPKDNHLLARLPPDEYERLLPHLQAVNLALGTRIYEHGQKQTHAYFPTTCILAFLRADSEGQSTKIGMAGRDGMAGLTQVLNDQPTLNLTLVQSPGLAWRLAIEVLQREFFRGGSLMYELLRYTQLYLTQVSQVSMCNRLHLLQQQLCRWMLFTLDRQDTAEIASTQEMMASLLGVRRQGVSKAIAQLQAEGIIARRRGKISILERDQLEQKACECHQVVKMEHSRLFPNLEADALPTPSHFSNALARNYLNQRTNSLEKAISGSGLAWWDFNLLTDTNQEKNCEAWTGMLGYAPGEFFPTGSEWEAMIHPDDLVLWTEARRSHLSGETTVYKCDYRIRHRDGHWIWISARGRVIDRDHAGNALRMVGTNKNITARKESEAALQKLVRTDFLTGAVTRREFFEQSEREFSRAQRHLTPLAVLSMDLDRFKNINDNYGHAAGDEVLKRFTKTVNHFLRVTDVFARLGGEEFCLLLPHTDMAGAKVLAERIMAAVRDTPVLVGTDNIHYTISSGLSTKTPTTLSFDELLKQSDQALYQAKSAGRNRVLVYGRATESLNTNDTSSSRL